MTQTGYRNGAIGKKGNGQADKYKQDRKISRQKNVLKNCLLHFILYLYFYLKYIFKLNRYCNCEKIYCLVPGQHSYGRDWVSD